MEKTIDPVNGAKIRFELNSLGGIHLSLHLHTTYCATQISPEEIPAFKAAVDEILSESAHIQTMRKFCFGARVSHMLCGRPKKGGIIIESLSPTVFRVAFEREGTKIIHADELIIDESKPA